MQPNAGSKATPAFRGQVTVTVQAIAATTAARTPGVRVSGRFERWLGARLVYSEAVNGLTGRDGTVTLRTKGTWAAGKASLRFCLTALTKVGLKAMQTTQCTLSK
jgi:hypothetical protein